MDRRAFMRMGGAGALAIGGSAASAALGWPHSIAAAASRGAIEAAAAPPDITLTTAPVTVEFAPNLVFSTIGYNGISPGPILRMREGVPQIVEVVNDTDVPEQVHWHGLCLPSELDGAEEEGTPPVPPRSRQRYHFTPTPAGTRWYHTHTMAMSDLHRGSYTGQFGFLIIEGKNDAGAYDQEIFLALRDWEPYFTPQMADMDALGPRWPQPERPDVADIRPNGLEVNAAFYSINDKALGAGEPIRVRAGQRVLFHLLNAGAIENRSIALPGHAFRVLALDGNPVPSPQLVEQIVLGPGERVDATVDMTHPGVWIMGAVEDNVRKGGLGVVVEYAGQRRPPEWLPPARSPWDYTLFGETFAGAAVPPRPPTDTIEMLFEKVPRAHEDKFNAYLINGRSYPHDREFVLREGRRYRLVLRNRTDDAHPLHLHRHLFELVEIYGKATTGVMKDTIVVPRFGRAVVEFEADQPGLTLFHCHIQQHMDYGFKALFHYA
jgi:FtsP/CotA-like multicopper oxidase with cupredoxin domain